MLMNFEVEMINPRGFCAGVDRAIEIVNRVLKVFDKPVYVHHEVVHNRFVVRSLQQKGAVFVENIEQVPDQAKLVYSAHGVSAQVEFAAQDKQLDVFDATCPLVTKVHLEVIRAANHGHSVILIGHAGHPEVIGTLGRFPDDAAGKIVLIESPQCVAKLDFSTTEKLSYVTQTTLSVGDTQVIIDLLKARYPQITGPKSDDICYATQNRQNAVIEASGEDVVVIVVGSSNSSNSNRLCEIAKKSGSQSWLVDHPDQLQQQWFSEGKKVVLTAGASAPEELVQDVAHQLKRMGGRINPTERGRPEEVSFPLPKGLRVTSV